MQSNMACLFDSPEFVETDGPLTGDLFPMKKFEIDTSRVGDQQSYRDFHYLSWIRSYFKLLSFISYNL